MAMLYTSSILCTSNLTAETVQTPPTAEQVQHLENALLNLTVVTAFTSFIGEQSEHNTEFVIAELETAYAGSTEQWLGVEGAHIVYSGIGVSRYGTSIDARLAPIWADQAGDYTQVSITSVAEPLQQTLKDRASALAKATVQWLYDKQSTPDVAKFHNLNFIDTLIADGYWSI